MSRANPRRSLVRQRDQADCGVACLATVVRHLGGDVSLEQLRDISGTSAHGTTLLGLFQAASEIGLAGQAVRATAAALERLTDLSILHVVKPGGLQHYVVCFGFQDGRFEIGDPGDGFVRWTPTELKERWTSGATLILRPTERVLPARQVRSRQAAWVRRLLNEDVDIFIGALFLGVAIATTSLATALFSQQLIDNILPARDLARLTLGLALLFVLLITRAGVGALRQWFLLKQGVRFSNRVIRYFYRSLLHLRVSFFRTRKVGDMVARMNDTGRIQRAVSQLVGSVIIDVLLVVAVALTTFLYSGRLGVVATTAVPVYAILAAVFHRQILSGQHAVMAAQALNESNYVDTIQGIDTIKISHSEERFVESTAGIYALLQASILRLGKVAIRFSAASEMLSVTYIVGTIAWSSTMVLKHTLTLGQMMAMLQLIGVMMPAAVRLALTNLQLQEARVALERMFNFTMLDPETDAAGDSSAVASTAIQRLDVKGLTFAFPGRTPLLRAVSFSVARGESIVLFGESGCGKTTTLEVLQRFHSSIGGEVLVNGRPWAEIGTREWRRQVGSVPQLVKIFNGTLSSNISLSSLPADHVEVISMCRSYGLDTHFLTLPQGYTTPVGEDGVSLSGGQRQLVAVARALFQRPKLLLLDEATSAMDRDTEAMVLELIGRIRAEMCVIWVTHRLIPAKHADRIYVIEEGQIRVSGTHDELRSRPNAYARAWADVLG